MCTSSDFLPTFSRVYKRQGPLLYQALASAIENTFKRTLPKDAKKEGLTRTTMSQPGHIAFAYVSCAHSAYTLSSRHQVYALQVANVKSLGYADIQQLIKLSQHK